MKHKTTKKFSVKHNLNKINYYAFLLFINILYRFILDYKY